MQPVRVAVIGAGYMGERHARIYAGLPDVELVAVCDVREATARELADRTGASAYADFGALLRRDDVDAVSVCTPDGLHREPCELALRSGRHVLVEKPIATTVPDADAIVEAAARAGAVLLVGHCLRFDPRYDQARQAIERGELGSVPTMPSHRRTPSGRSGSRLPSSGRPPRGLRSLLDGRAQSTGGPAVSREGSRAGREGAGCSGKGR